MAGGDTKRRILKEALRLFSVRGYEGVSVRDIAAAVGLREGALYRHFANKQAIFDTLLCEMQARYEAATAQMRLPDTGAERDALRYAQGGLGLLEEICPQMFLFWLRDETAGAFRRMLTIEQFSQTRAGEVFRQLLVDAPIAYQEALFQEMIRVGYFREGDARAMAMQFYGPIFLLLCRYDGAEGEEAQALEALRVHARQFERAYRA